MKPWSYSVAVVFTFLGVLAQAAQPQNSDNRDKNGFLIAPSGGPDKAALTNEIASPTFTTAAVAIPTTAATNSESPTTGGTNNNYVNDDKHKLNAGDKVSFQILQDRGQPVALQVTESSEIDIPYIGRVNVDGKTCRQLADGVKEQLEKDYYKRATVIIGLDAMAKIIGRVYVWGPVRNQGPIEIPANETFTASKAILRAGGFGDFANKKEVKVIRKTPTGNVTLKVNLVDVLEKGKTDQDIPLEPEDFIIVPQRAINF